MNFLFEMAKCARHVLPTGESTLTMRRAIY